MPLFLSKGGATDVHGSQINLCHDVRDIIANIQDCGILIAAASRYVLLESLRLAKLNARILITLSSTCTCIALPLQKHHVSYRRSWEFMINLISVKSILDANLNTLKSSDAGVCSSLNVLNFFQLTKEKSSRLSRHDIL